MCGPRGLRGDGDHLFHNDGDGTFTDVSARAGVADAAGLFGFGVGFFDFDDDGRPDLFVANDSTPNYLYRNRGDGTFQDVSYASGAALDEAGREQAHMGVAIGDYDNDGRDDLHITNFADDYNVLYHNDGKRPLLGRQLSGGRRAPEHPVPGLGDRVRRLRQRRLAGPRRRQRPRLSHRRPVRLEHVLPATDAAVPEPEGPVRRGRRLGRDRGWPCRGPAAAWPPETSTTTATSTSC